MTRFQSLCQNPNIAALRDRGILNGARAESAPRGLLRTGDIVDYLPCLAPRRVTLLDLLDGAGQPLTAQRWEAEFIAPARQRGYLREGWEPRRTTRER